MKYGGKAMKGMGKAANATGKSAGHAVLHPSQTLRGAGQAVKTATAGAAVGYVGWEKLTTDKSVARIVSEAVVGKSATDALAGTTEDMKELKDKAGETVSAIGEAVGGADSKLNGVSNFLREASGGGLFNMLSGFLRNLGGGNVSGLNIAGLIAAAYLVFGRFGWLGKIAGLFLGMMLIGNNAGVVRTVPSETVSRTQTRCYMLSAVASGIVSGVGNDPVHGICQTVRYGGYEVTYGHLSNVFAQFGQRVKAGQTVALSGELLHIEVKFKGEELNPIEFLTMLYGNIKALQEADGNGAASFYDAETRVKNDYEKDQREIEELMLRFLPLYMEDLQRGAYTVPAHTEQSLRHIFTMGAAKEYFYEKMPSMYNPLGLGRKAMPLACKVQNLLIADFLNYLALRHDVYLSATGGEVKKNFMTKP